MKGLREIATETSRDTYLIEILFMSSYIFVVLSLIAYVV